MNTKAIMNQAKIIAGYYLANSSTHKEAFEKAKAEGAFKGAFGSDVHMYMTCDSRNSHYAYDKAYEEAYGAYDADAEYDTPEFEEYLARFAD